MTVLAKVSAASEMLAELNRRGHKRGRPQGVLCVESERSRDTSAMPVAAGEVVVFTGQ